MARRKLLVFIRQGVQSVASERYVMGLSDFIWPVLANSLYPLLS